MSVKYINRKDQIYYLHQSTTKTGKPKYFFSLKQPAQQVNTIPDGFEIYENPNGQVFLRKIQPQFIRDEEIAIVKNGIEKFSLLKFDQIDVRKKILTIKVPERNVEQFFDEHLRPIFKLESSELRTKFVRRSTYSAMLRFVLIDEKERKFLTQRYCFLGSIDDWIEIGQIDSLDNLVRTYVKHLGLDSYYELH